MIKIRKMPTYNLRNDAHFQFHTEFNDLVTRTGAETLKVRPLFDKLVPLFHKEDVSIKKISKSAITKRIDDADKARDETWLGMVEVNSGNMKHFDPAVKESARVLKIVFDTYGNVARKPFNEQTSAIYNIVQDLTGKYSADVTRVGLVPWVTELQNRNSQFDALMKERYDEAATKCDIDVREARAEVDEIYFAIVDSINAFIIAEGEDDYREFVKTLNAIIAKYKGRKRNAGSSGAEEEEIPDDDGDDDSQDGQQEQDI